MTHACTHLHFLTIQVLLGLFSLCLGSPIFIHTCNAGMYTYSHVCIYACTQKFVHARMHSCSYRSTHKHMHAYANNACTHMHMFDYSNFTLFFPYWVTDLVYLYFLCISGELKFDLYLDMICDIMLCLG